MPNLAGFVNPVVLREGILMAEGSCFGGFMV
jgi:hypothetical protein